MKYYKFAIDKGMTEAMKSYADFLLQNENCSESDKEEAARLYKKAADESTSEKMKIDYAVLLIKGEKIPQNKEEGMQILQE